MKAHGFSEEKDDVLFSYRQNIKKGSTVTMNSPIRALPCGEDDMLYFLYPSTVNS